MNEQYRLEIELIEVGDSMLLWNDELQDWKVHVVLGIDRTSNPYGAEHFHLTLSDSRLVRSLTGCMFYVPEITYNLRRKRTAEEKLKAVIDELHLRYDRARAERERATEPSIAWVRLAELLFVAHYGFDRHDGDHDEKWNSFLAELKESRGH